MSFLFVPSPILFFHLYLLFIVSFVFIRVFSLICLAFVFFFLPLKNIIKILKYSLYFGNYILHMHLIKIRNNVDI